MNIPAEFLNLSHEAIVLLRGNTVFYSNPAAAEFFGRDITGRSIRDCFGPELAAIQAGNYSAAMSVCGRSCTLRSVVADNIQAVTLSPVTGESMDINPNFFSSLNSTLMDMSIISSSCSDMETLQNDPELRRAFNAYLRDYYKLKRVTSNAQTALNIFSGELPFFPDTRNLTTLISSYIEGAESLFPAVRFSLSAPDDLVLCFDKQLVLSAFSNLLVNSLMHSGCSRIHVTLIDDVNSAVISVSDDGCGIDPDILPGLFCKYKSSSSLSGNAGLGLTVVRGTAEIHNGVLLVESRKTMGTTARFSLSKAVRSQPHLRSNDDSPYASTEDVFTGLSAVLPEDAFI